MCLNWFFFLSFCFKIFFLIFALFYFTILYWFCYTLTWIHHGCACVPKHEPPFHLPPHNISLGYHCAPAPSMLYPASDIGKTLSDINHSRILYDPPPRILEIRAKINKWDLIKIKSFCTTKENISKVKRQPSEWEKNNSKWSNWQTTNLKNIQAAHAAQFQKNKWPSKKMGQKTK